MLAFIEYCVSSWNVTLPRVMFTGFYWVNVCLVFFVGECSGCIVHPITKLSLYEDSLGETALLDFLTGKSCVAS